MTTCKRLTNSLPKVSLITLSPRVTHEDFVCCSRICVCLCRSDNYSTDGGAIVIDTSVPQVSDGGNKRKYKNYAASGPESGVICRVVGMNKIGVVFPCSGRSPQRLVSIIAAWGLAQIANPSSVYRGQCQVRWANGAMAGNRSRSATKREAGSCVSTIENDYNIIPVHRAWKTRTYQSGRKYEKRRTVLIPNLIPNGPYISVHSGI